MVEEINPGASAGGRLQFWELLMRGERKGVVESRKGVNVAVSLPSRPSLKATIT